MIDQRLRRWPNVERTLAECTMLRKSCLVNTHYWGSCFTIPAVIFKVTQLRARAIKELLLLLTHRCHSSIYGLAMIWKLALNAAVGIKRIS